MGTFSHSITLLAASGDRTEALEALEALVDTGAMFTVIPASVLERLDVRPLRTITVRFDDERAEEWGMGEVQAELNGRRTPIVCLFGPEDALPRIGTHALDAFLLAADPMEQKLVPKEALLTLA